MNYVHISNISSQPAWQMAQSSFPPAAKLHVVLAAAGDVYELTDAPAPGGVRAYANAEIDNKTRAALVKQALANSVSVVDVHETDDTLAVSLHAEFERLLQADERLHQRYLRLARDLKIDYSVPNATTLQAIADAKNGITTRTTLDKL